MSELISPEERENRKKTSKKKAAAKTKAKAEAPREKYLNKGNKVKIELESGGRFSAPPILWFADYTADHVNNIITSRMEDMTETLIHCLDECLDRQASGVDNDFTCADLTHNEMNEVLLGMKLQFDSVFLNHVWMCHCQDDLNEKDRKASEQSIDLSNAGYKSIESIDEEQREIQLAALNRMSDEDFEAWKDKVYKDRPDERLETREEIANNFTIQEPLRVWDMDENGDYVHYEFEFLRMRHIIESSNDANRLFDNQLRVARGRKHKGNGQDERKALRQEEIEKIEREKGRAALKYSQAYCMIGYNGERDLSKQRKIELYKKMSQSAMRSMLSAFNLTDYGLHHEFESVCNLCDHTERRWLQRELHPLELLPVPDTDRISAVSKPDRDAGLDFFFG